MAKTRKALLGWLGLVLALAVLGIMIRLTGLWHSTGPRDDEGGGPFAVVGILGFILFVVIFTIVVIVQTFFPGTRPDRRGFDVIEADKRPDGMRDT